MSVTMRRVLCLSICVLLAPVLFSPVLAAGDVSGGCHPSCWCLGIQCPRPTGDCSGCGTGSDPGTGIGGGDTCPAGQVCPTPGGGDPPSPPPASCYSILLEAQCVDIEGEDDDCVCGHSATDVEQFHYHVCVETLNLIPLPPNGNCDFICGDLEPPLDLGCQEVCEELCQDNPLCIDLSDILIDLICCDLATGTEVPWADCYNPTIHPFPANPSSQCCNDNNENSWVHGCEQCCAAQSQYGSSTWALCVQKCGTTPIQQGWCAF